MTFGARRGFTACTGRWRQAARGFLMAHHLHALTRMGVLGRDGTATRGHSPCYGKYTTPTEKMSTETSPLAE